MTAAQPALTSDAVVRPLWLRVLRYPLVLLVIGFVWLAASEILPFMGVRRLIGGERGTPLPPLVEIGVAIWLMVSWKLYKRWGEGAPDRELALPGALREWAAGLAIGFGLFSLMAGVVALLGGLRITGMGGAQGMGHLGMMLGMAAISGVGEELVFRGVILRQLERLVGTWGALALTSAFFGAAHLSNKDATWFAAMAIALEAGILLGAAYLLTRRLWLAMGIHSAWNFTQGWVFSAPVSGGGAPAGLFITERHGPEWLTGGAFGLEASAVAMVVATLAGVILLVRVVRAGGIVPPAWSKAAQTKE